MSFSIKIARRYLFSKKNANAVNIITGIAMGGIMVGTAALILVMSVFNGFEDLITGLFNDFNPDVKVTIAEGKVFRPDSAAIAQLEALEEVTAVSKTLEEVAFFEYDGSQDFGILKGVDNNYGIVSAVDSNMIRGDFVFDDGEYYYAVMGLGIENKLLVNIQDRLKSLNVYMPRRQRSVSLLSNAFKKRFVYPAGTFSIQQEFDDQYVLVSLDFARELLNYREEVSALEIGLKTGTNAKEAVKKIAAIMGNEYEVKDRYKQDEAFFKLMNMEKWVGYAVLSFTLLLVSFNMIGALWMLVLDKKNDIAILKSMGASDGVIRRIFLNAGIYLSILGGGIGMLAALLIYVLQKTVGIIRLGDDANLIVSSYPISLRFMDLVAVFVTVVIIGAIASWLPASRAKRIPALIREE